MLHYQKFNVWPTRHGFEKEDIVKVDETFNMEPQVPQLRETK